MTYSHYDRLSALDVTFLEIEEPNVHMHVSAIALFEAAALTTADGNLEIERIRDAVEASLAASPRFRQRLAHVPLFEHPVWVDDERFNLAYHVRHTSLPRPGDVRLLKRLAGRILSQKLDRGKPLWEMWVVEGIEDGRFAVLMKAHHCMVDGIAGMELLAALMRLDRDASLPEERAFRPRPAPGEARMLFDELAHRASLPLDLLRGVPESLRSPGRVLSSLRESISTLGETIGAGLAPTVDTPFDVELGPYRRFDWIRTPISRVKEIRKHLGGTLNDVVLATAAGAVGRFLRGRGTDFDEDDVFRVLVPVSVRRQDQRGHPGNRVVNFLARLPVDEDDPRRRLERTIEETRELKSTRRVEGAELLEDIADRTFDSLLTGFVQLAANTHAYNMVVTNVPGPRQPVYLLGARLEEIYPLVPLFKGQGLGVALFSYDGDLYWGFSADWDAFPDLHNFALQVGEEFDLLHAAAEQASRDAPT